MFIILYIEQVSNIPDLRFGGLHMKKQWNFYTVLVLCLILLTAGFSQQITVENVSASNFEQVVGDHTTDFVRVTVRIFQNAREISSASWLRARY